MTTIKILKNIIYLSEMTSLKNYGIIVSDVQKMNEGVFMEDNEMMILEIIEKKANATQREISKSSGMSLGTVNILLKRFVKKGFVKLEKINSNTFKYILTPKGFNEKSKKTLEYIKIYYAKTMILKQNIISVKEKYGGCVFVLFGPDDEVREITEGLLHELDTAFVYENNINSISKESIVLYWDADNAQDLSDFRCEFLLGKIN